MGYVLSRHHLPGFSQHFAKGAFVIVILTSGKIGPHGGSVNVLEVT